MSAVGNPLDDAAPDLPVMRSPTRHHRNSRQSSGSGIDFFRFAQVFDHEKAVESELEIADPQCLGRRVDPLRHRATDQLPRPSYPTAATSIVAADRDRAMIQQPRLDDGASLDRRAHRGWPVEALRTAQIGGSPSSRVGCGMVAPCARPGRAVVALTTGSLACSCIGVDGDPADERPECLCAHPVLSGASSTGAHDLSRS